MKLKQIVTQGFDKLTSQKEDNKVFQLLDTCLDRIFPDQNFAVESVKNLNSEDKSKRAVVKELLPFHTRDVEWLAIYLEQAVNKLPTVAMGSVAFDEIKKYIMESPKFDDRRNQYERYVVKGCIEAVKNHKKDDWFSLASIKESDHKNNFYDKAFRERVKKTALNLGVDNYNVEVALELYADAWREQTRAVAFENTYNPDRLLTVVERNWIKQSQPSALDNLENQRGDLYCRWNRLRDYEYYQEHQVLLDHLDLANADMKMSQDDAQKLKREITTMGFAYQQSLRQCCREHADLLASNPMKKVPTAEKTM